jgi:hypothetical protein
LGSIASAKLGRPDADLPNFVCLGGSAFGAGYAGPQHAPVEIADPARGIDNLKALGGLSAFDKKASLLEEIEELLGNGLKLGWFNRLKISKRTWMLILSVILVFLTRLKSHCLNPGPRKALRRCRWPTH